MIENFVISLDSAEENDNNARKRSSTLKQHGFVKSIYKS